MAVSFFFDLNSPYAYLAAHRVEDVLGPRVDWRPIAFGPLLVATQRVPWSLTPGEREAGQRECERRAAERGLPPIVWPDGWPDRTYSVNGARAALAAKRGGRVRELSLAIFERVFVHGGRLSDPDVIAAAAQDAGVDGILDAIADPELKAALRAETDEAMARGVVGIPTVATADGELFWGDDQLEAAAAAAGAGEAG